MSDYWTATDWLLTITVFSILNGGGMYLDDYKELPFADEQDCRDSAVRHNEAFTEATQRNPSPTRRHAQCIPNYHKRKEREGKE